jgi:peptidoglycan/LPS O-acetylase OafA/YrhL
MTRKPVVLADILAPERNNFGALRLAMALAVLVSNSYWLATGQVVAEPLKGLTGFTLGEHAVQVFFFLSGVVVAQSIMKSGSLLDFTVARVLRIFPALIVCVLLTALVIGPMATDLPLGRYFTDRGMLDYLWRTLSLSTGSAPLPGVFGDHPVPHLVNLSLWTLKYEVACYVLLGLFGWAYLKLPRLRAPLAMALAVAVVAAFAANARPVEPLSGLGSLRYFVVFFFAGTLAYLARERLVITWMALPPLLALFALAIKTPFAELAAALFLGYATLWAAALPAGGLRTFTNAQD